MFVPWFSMQPLSRKDLELYFLLAFGEGGGGGRGSMRNWCRSFRKIDNIHLWDKDWVSVCLSQRIHGEAPTKAHENPGWLKRGEWRLIKERGVEVDKGGGRGVERRDFQATTSLQAHPWLSVHHIPFFPPWWRNLQSAMPEVQNPGCSFRSFSSSYQSTPDTLLGFMRILTMPICNSSSTSTPPAPFA